MTDRVLDHLVLFIIWSLRGWTLLTILKWSFEGAKHLSEQIVKNGEEQTDKDKSIHSGWLMIGPQYYETQLYLSRCSPSVDWCSYSISRIIRPIYE